MIGQLPNHTLGFSPLRLRNRIGGESGAESDAESGAERGVKNGGEGGRSPSPSPAKREPEKNAVLRVVCAGTPECNDLYYEADEGPKYTKVDDLRVEIVEPKLWKIQAAPG